MNDMRQIDLSTMTDDALRTLAAEIEAELRRRAARLLMEEQSDPPTAESETAVSSPSSGVTS